MQPFTRLTWVELKLFIREPFAVIFTFAFPILVMVVITGAFDRDDPAFGGAPPVDYYLSSYIGVVIAAIGLIAIPVHLATYWERGILRRFRASSLSTIVMLGALTIVGILMSIIGAVVLTVVATLLYDAKLPDAWAQIALVFLVSSIAFIGLGILLAAITRTARAAQAVGLMLYFPMLLLGGAGPPPSVMNSAMQTVSDVLPLTWAVRALQDAWFDNTLAWSNIGGLALLTAIALALSLRLFRDA